MANKKGFMASMAEAAERSENYSRTAASTGRWKLGWEVFKNNFTRLILLNLILVVFFIPVIVIVFWRNMLISTYASAVPFGSFMSYPYVANLSGVAENVVVRANIRSLATLPAAALLIAVAFSGVFYMVRNMVWTEGVFIGSDFWRGLKKNFFPVAGTLLIYSTMVYGGLVSVSLMNYSISVGAANAVLLTVAKVAIFVLLGFFTIVAMHMLTLSVTYELSFIKLIRNAFILTVSLLPSNIFFAAFSLAGVVLMLFSAMIGGMVAIIIGIVGGILVWTVYCQWIYEKFISDVPAKKPRSAEKQDKQPESAEPTSDYDGDFETVYLNKRPVKPVTDSEVEIAELPATFGRDDLKKLAESKEAMKKDSDKYVEDVLSGKITEKKAEPDPGDEIEDE
ncbi:MAG: hypothetical protein J6126_02800 [Clostridia bacterium]|nr:hypothetical protein [Clostridia bacterium]